MMKKLLFIVFILLQGALMYAQEPVIGDMHNDFDDLDTIPKAPPKTLHLIGAQYSFHYCGVSLTPSGIDHHYTTTYKNFSVLYTYLHNMWNTMPWFGIQTGVKYGSEGFISDYGDYGQTYNYVEVPLHAMVRVDVSRIRIMFNLGPYCAYRLNNSKGHFDKYDIRFDYGIGASLGLAVIFKPFEIHISGGYNYSLQSMYHTYKYNDLYWVLAYPRCVTVNAGLHFQLW